MNNHLLKHSSKYITPNFIAQVADTLDESETNVFNVMSATTPTFLIGLLNNTTVIDKIMVLANQKEFDAPYILSDLPSLLTNKSHTVALETGNQFINTLFDNKKTFVFDILGKNSSLKKSSVYRLMQISASMTLAFIKKSGLDADQLNKDLLYQKDDIIMASPVGLQALLTQNTPSLQKNKKIKNRKNKNPKTLKHRWILPFLIFIISVLLLIIMK